MSELVIRITLPDGATYRVVTEPESVLGEPLPPEPGILSDGSPIGRGMAQASQIWAVGQVHMAGHQPLKMGQKGGLFCPSKVGVNPDGSAQWCRFRP